MLGFSPGKVRNEDVEETVSAKPAQILPTPGGLVMNFQRQERHLRWAEEANTWAARRDPGCSVPLESEPKPIPPRRARTVAPEPLPPFSALVEIPCQDCGAKGYDAGSLNPHQPEVCRACQGSGKETVLRNY